MEANRVDGTAAGRRAGARRPAVREPAPSRSVGCRDTCDTRAKTAQVLGLTNDRGYCGPGAAM
jgi:hypothetical protein